MMALCKTLSQRISDEYFRRQETTEEHAVTHQSVGLMLFVHQDTSAAPFCHFYGRSCIPVSGGTGDGGDASGPGLVYITWWVWTAAVVWLAFWASPPVVQTIWNVKCACICFFLHCCQKTHMLATGFLYHCSLFLVNPTYTIRLP